MLFEFETWRPVFDPNGHIVDVFSQEELNRVGGSKGLIERLKAKGVTANIIDVPESVALCLIGQQLIGVRHEAKDGVHELYKFFLLQKEPMLMPIQRAPQEKKRVKK